MHKRPKPGTDARIWSAGSSRCRSGNARPNRSMRRPSAHLFANGECLSDTRRNLFTYRFHRRSPPDHGHLRCRLRKRKSRCSQPCRAVCTKNCACRSCTADRIPVEGDQFDFRCAPSGHHSCAMERHHRGERMQRPGHRLICQCWPRELADSACDGTAPPMRSSGSVVPSRTGKLQRAAAPFYPYFAGLLDRIAG